MSQNVILLVDDDPVFSRFTENILTEGGMKVILAFNKAEGLAMFEQHHPSCVILDIFLPDGSGIDLIKPVRDAAPKVPIIMVSGQSEVDDVVRAMKDGANDYIKKPFRGEELLLKIQMVLEAFQTRWELDALKTQSRAEEEYKLLFSLSDRMNKVQAILDQVANTDITVLITGESGTGKELVAKALHKSSERVGEPFIKVNCAALPRELLESELFGFEKGAFTGAHRRKYGRFEMAQNGTIFLDEISEMHQDLQSKLLHVLQEKQFYRIGGEREIKVNCRILTATNKSLEELVDDGRFRRDLFYRINVVNIVVPPLRERKEDIPLLADYFLKRYEEMYNRDSLKISPRLMEMFLVYAWPGNVRELENSIKRLIILGNEDQLIAEMERKQGTGRLVPMQAEEGRHFLRPDPTGRDPEEDVFPTTRKNELPIADKATLKEVAKIAQRNAERDLIERVLRQTRWNRRKAAQILDISYKALLYKIKECGLNQE
jgi:two-component system response regulator AtoC